MSQKSWLNKALMTWSGSCCSFFYVCVRSDFVSEIVKRQWTSSGTSTAGLFLFCCKVHIYSQCASVTSQVCHPAASQPGAASTLETVADEVAVGEEKPFERCTTDRGAEKALCHSRLCQRASPTSPRELFLSSAHPSFALLSACANLRSFPLLFRCSEHKAAAVAPLSYGDWKPVPAGGGVTLNYW